MTLIYIYIYNDTQSKLVCEYRRFYRLLTYYYALCARTRNETGLNQRTCAQVGAEMKLQLTTYKLQLADKATRTPACKFQTHTFTRAGAPAQQQYARLYYFYAGTGLCVKHATAHYAEVGMNFRSLELQLL